MEKVVKRKKPKPTIFDKAKYMQYLVKEKLMLNNGKIRKFDADLYKMLDGKYINGLPLYYYMREEWTMGKCFDASVRLALAFPENANICRGYLSNLNYQSKVNDRGNKFVHGWVEMDGFVYDTTWKYIMKKEDYYSLFKPKHVSVTPKDKFIEDCKELGSFEVHDKEWWEDNYMPFVNCTVLLAYRIAETILATHGISQEEKEYYTKFLSDLPGLEKINQLAKEHEKQCMRDIAQGKASGKKISASI